jgi:hypothetical protein
MGVPFAKHQKQVLFTYSFEYHCLWGFWVMWQLCNLFWVNRSSIYRTCLHPCLSETFDYIRRRWITLKEEKSGKGSPAMWYIGWFLCKKKRARGKSIYPYLIDFISLSLLKILCPGLIFIAGYWYMYLWDTEIRQYVGQWDERPGHSKITQTFILSRSRCSLSYIFSWRCCIKCLWKRKTAWSWRNQGRGREITCRTRICWRPSSCWKCFYSKGTFA